MTETVDAVVIGAGVIGLSVARALALAGREVLIVEQGSYFGAETSSRSSEVIHAGIYYPKTSLKARLCLAGRQALYAYAATHGVPYARTGKLIVAAREAELAKLLEIHARARAGGVDDIRLLTRTEALAMEPDLECAGALYSPSTGIIDSHALMLAYLGDAEALGAILALKTPVLQGAVGDDGIKLTLGGAQPLSLKARILINAAGFSAPALAGRISGLPPAGIPAAYFCKGSYFQLSGQSPFSRLIYPLPEAAGIGVHLTLDMAGQARFGPDVEWVKAVDYEVDPARAGKFYAAIRRYWPGLKDGRLQPGYAGIRPKISGPGEAAADFKISGPKDHGITGLVNLFGIESPGLTASLAIGEMAAALALAR